jgi:hypothetical protein
VDGSVVSEYKPKLLELVSPYEPKHIYNADETRLVFRALPTKSLVVKGGKVYWGQNIRRKTVLLCGNMVEKNGKASRDWKSSKTNMIQEPEN